MKWLTTLCLLAVARALLAQDAPLSGVTTNGPQSLSGLQQRIEAILDNPRYDAALWGVKIVSLDSGRTLFERNAGKLFSPASNCKLYTVALGLERLGPDYRIRTSLYAKAAPDAAGVLEGDLIVFGRGDPTFKTSATGDVLAALDPLVAAVTNAGIRTIRGRLIADDSYFRGPEFGSGWAWDDQQFYYGAEISALTLQDNLLWMTVKPGAEIGAPCEISFNPTVSFMRVQNRTTTGTTNSGRTLSAYRAPSRNSLHVTGALPAGGNAFSDDVTVHHPARMFAELFAAALARRGVRLDGDYTSMGWLDRAQASPKTADLVEIGFVESPPLSEIAARIQKPSQNLYTDLLLAHVGEKSRTAETPASATSEELGIAQMHKFLARAGIQKGQYFLEEGSGLSRDNLVTPAATAALLQFMSKHSAFESYKSALPIAGVDGTLRNRMKGTAAAGNLRGKTGTLRWASSLSGYVTSGAGENLAFSFMVNRYHPAAPSPSSRTDLDALAVLLATLEVKSEP